MKIGIIGLGYVGTTMQRLFADHADLVTYDAAQPGPYPHEQFADCDLALVCVSTPPGPDGACDTSNVYDAVKRLPTRHILLRSTVAPGTTDHLGEITGKSVCFAPEYVGESRYYQPFFSTDAATVPFLVVGGAPAARRHVIDMLLPVLGPSKAYFQCTALEAELVKYMENTYFATKVTFVNEFARICAAFGADWHTVREGWLLDPRIEPMHTAVFANAPGFGGKCLPKDLAAIIHAARQADYIPALLEQVRTSNNQFRADGNQA